MKKLIGSNQYQDKTEGLSRKCWRSVCAILVIIVLSLVLGHVYQNWKQAQFKEWEKGILSPMSNVLVKTVFAKEEKSQLQEIIDYIVYKFLPLGRPAVTWALSCFISESHLNPEAYNFNSNGTWDFGIAQWNQVHGQTIDEIRDWKKQIDLAFDLYKRQGKTPWYGNGCK